MLLHVVNFYEAPRFTAKAAAAIDLGAVIKISDDGKGGRLATQVADADSASLVAGKYGLALKVSADPLQVTASDVSTSEFGSRVVSIASGDFIVECRKGTIMEYDPSLLHASITASNVVAGEVLAVKGGKFCKVGTAGSIAAPVVGVVYNVHNGKVRIELV